MLAQVYKDDEMVRIFDQFGVWFCDIICIPTSFKVADKQLRYFKMRRRELWRKTDWGFEAKIRHIK